MASWTEVTAGGELTADDQAELTKLEIPFPLDEHNALLLDNVHPRGHPDPDPVSSQATEPDHPPLTLLWPDERRVRSGCDWRRRRRFGIGKTDRSPRRSLRFDRGEPSRRRLPQCGLRTIQSTDPRCSGRQRG